MRWYWRLLLSIGGAISGGVVAALALTILDLYLAGHLRPSLNRMYVGHEARLLSVADVILLASVLVSGLIVWVALRAVARSR